MTHFELRQRTLRYAIAVAVFARRLEATPVGRPAAGQLIRASSSIAANYRAAGIARSHKEFIAKLGLVVEEADECVFWLEYIGGVQLQPESDLAELSDEADQLLRIFTSARSTARRSSDRPIVRSSDFT